MGKTLLHLSLMPTGCMITEQAHKVRKACIYCFSNLDTIIELQNISVCLTTTFSLSSGIKKSYP